MDHSEIRNKVEKFADYMGRTLPPVGVALLLDLVETAYNEGFLDGASKAASDFIKIIID